MERAPAILAAMRAAILALVLAACGPMTRSKSQVGVWNELRSTRYVLYSDESVDVARAKLVTLERVTSLVGLVYANGVDPRAAPIVVISQGACESSGLLHARTGTLQDFSQRRVVYACGAKASLGVEVAVHVRLHELAARFLPTMPPWLEEGMAWYFASSRLAPEGLEVGHAPMGYERGPSRPMLSAEVRSMGREDLEKDQTKRWAAWALVATLYGDHPEKLKAYLRALSASSNPVPWSGVDDETLDAAIEALARRGPTQGRMLQAPTRESEITVRVLGNGEALALWAQVLLMPMRDEPTSDLGDVLAQLALADQAEPGADLGLFWRGVLAFQYPTAKGAPQDAEGLLRAYLERHPTEERALIGIVRLGLGRLAASRGTKLTGLEATPPPGIETLDADIGRLAAASSTETGLNTVAWYYALAHRPELGLPYARRAVVTDPACWPCLDTLAVLAFQAGKVDEAIAVVQRAIDLGGDLDVDVEKALSGRLEVYRTARATPTSAPTAPVAE